MLKYVYMQEKQKILYIITKGNWGGAQKYVYDLSLSAKDKYEPIVAFGAGQILKEKLEKAGIKTFEIKSLQRDISIYSEIKSFWQIFKIIKKEKPKTIHLNSPKASGLGSFAGRLLFVPNIIQTIHGLSLNEKRPYYQKIFIYFFTLITLILCHKTIAISEMEQKQIKRIFKISSKKILLIKNGITATDYYQRELAREKITEIIKQIPKSSFWIGSIAELHKNKGLKYLLEALSKIEKDISLFIFGEGDERNKLEEMINRQNLQTKVFLLGFKEDAIKHLKAFDLFVLPSVKEGLPYVLLEAGLAEMPVIASDVGGVKEIIDHNQTGLLSKSMDYKDLKEKIEFIINNPLKAREFAEKLKVKIETNFNKKDMVEKTMRLY